MHLPGRPVLPARPVFPGRPVPSSQTGASLGSQTVMDGNGQYNRMNMGHIPPEPAQHPKKKKGMASRVAGITAAALLFGTVAGGTMFGVNSLAEYLSGGNTEQIAQVETQQSVASAETQPSAPAGAPANYAIQMDVSGIVEQAMPSVVAITNTMLYQQQTWFGPEPDGGGAKQRFRHHRGTERQ